MLLDREVFLYALLVVAGIWIFWIDARPFVHGWWKKRQRSQIFEVLENVHCETRPVKSSADQERDTEFYENVFYLAVSNGLDTGQMLKRVQARIFHLGPPTLCRIKDSELDEVDIRHGEWVFFEIGRLISTEVMGVVYQRVVLPENRMEIYDHNIPRGYLSFEIYSVNNNREYGLGHQPERPIVWPLLMVISADDVQARRVNINIDMTKTRSPVWWELSP